MAELTTADPIVTPEDGDILPIRKASVAGTLKITLLQIATYVRDKIFGDLDGQAGKVPVVNETEDGFDWADPGGGGEGSPMVALTQSAYDALDPPDPDTYYFIID